MDEPIKVKRGRKSKKDIENAKMIEKKEEQVENVILEQSLTGGKKRGRKPKGGKIVNNQNLSLQVNVIKPNIILHLKCCLKDLPNNDLQIESYNYSATNLLYNVNPGPVQEDILGISLYNGALDSAADITLDKQAKHINTKVQELTLNLQTNNVFDKKSACFWCSCDFDNNTIYIPKTCIKGTYSVYGSFCSPECAAAHLMEESLDHSTKFERYHLLNHIYGKIYNYTKNIKPAPNPYYMLDKFYGNLTIQEYRALLKSDRLFLIVEKPLSRIFPQYYEDNDDFIINNKIIPTNYSSKKPSSSAPQNYNSAVFG
jgi:hypothetical protein